MMVGGGWSYRGPAGGCIESICFWRRWRRWCCGYWMRFCTPTLQLHR